MLVFILMNLWHEYASCAIVKQRAQLPPLRSRVRIWVPPSGHIVIMVMSRWNEQRKVYIQNNFFFIRSNNLSSKSHVHSSFIGSNNYFEKVCNIRILKCQFFKKTFAVTFTTH